MRIQSHQSKEGARVAVLAQLVDIVLQQVELLPHSSKGPGSILISGAVNV